MSELVTDLRLIKTVKKYLSNVNTRAVLQTIEQDEGKMFAQVTGRANQVRTGVEHIQQYGFRSKPKVGARGILHSVGGRINNAMLAIVDDKRFGSDPVYADGESRQYDDQGSFHRIFDKKHRLQGDDYELRIDDNNKIEFVAGSLKITVGGELYEFTSSKLQTTSADVVADTVSLQNHVHVIPGGSSAGNTNPPTP